MNEDLDHFVSLGVRRRVLERFHRQVFRFRLGGTSFWFFIFFSGFLVFGFSFFFPEVWKVWSWVVGFWNELIELKEKAKLLKAGSWLSWQSSGCCVKNYFEVLDSKAAVTRRTCSSAGRTWGSTCFGLFRRCISEKYNGRMLKHAMMIIRVEEKHDGFHGRLPFNYGNFFGIYSWATTDWKL